MQERNVSSRIVACALYGVSALAIGATLFAARSAHAGASASGPTPSVAVQVVRVTRQAISQQVVAYGSVGSAAANATTVSLPYIARVTRVLIQPGQTVTRGTPLFVVKADSGAVIAFAQAQSTATLARGELARTQALYRDGLATQSQLATAQKTLDDAKQALAAQSATGIALEAKTVMAPVAGVIAQLSIGQGDQVQAGAALTQIAGSSGPYAANVALGVEPVSASGIRAGDRVVLHPLAASQDGIQAQGRIVLIGASVDPQNQFVNVSANVPFTGMTFLPGTRVRADIDTQTGIWWEVPRAAVLEDATGKYVYQVARGSKAHRVAVTVKVEHGNDYGVDGALDAARPLVVSGNYELEEGMVVRMAQGGGAQ